jgi:hypothetical protein
MTGADAGDDPRAVFATRVDEVYRTLGERPPLDVPRALEVTGDLARQLREWEGRDGLAPDARACLASLRESLRDTAFRVAACVVTVEFEDVPGMILHRVLELVYLDAPPDDGWADPISEGVEGYLSESQHALV